MTDPSPRPLVVTVVLVLVSAGCLGVITGQEPASFEADPATVTDDTLQSTGYVETGVSPQVINRTVSAAGQSREVEVTNHVAEYERTVELAGASGEFARFTVVSTPAIELFGRTFNPVGDLSNRELAQRVQSEYGSIDDLEVAGERSVRVLGTATTVTRFTGTATVAGGVEIDVVIHLAKLEHDGDFVIAVAAHPSAIQGERGRVDSLLAGISH